jgi:hypothetical protein
MCERLQSKEMELLTAPANLPFSIALALVLLLGTLELVSLAFGGAVGILGGGEADADIDGLEAGGLFGEVMQWLHAGQLPLSVLMILFLLAFGSAGLLLQSALKSMSGTLLPALIAVVPAFLIALPATRLMGGLLKPIMPRDETEAVSRDSFLGCSAQITTGTARRGAPAEARLRDAFGRSHYVMVEPDRDEEVFPAGTRVVLLKRHDVIYRAIPDADLPFED